MHNVNTHGLGCAHAARWACHVGAHCGRIVASPRPCRACAWSCHSRVVAHRRRVVGCRVVGRLLRAMSRVGPRRVAAPTRSCHGPVSPRTHALLCVVSQASSAVSQRFIAALLRHIATQQSPLSHDTIFVSQLPHQPGPARVCDAAGPCARLAMSWLMLVVSWRAAVRIVALLLRAQPCLPSPMSRYNSLYRDPAQADGQ